MLHPFFGLDTVKVNGEFRWCCPNDEIYDRHWRKSTLSIHCNESNATIGRCEVSKTEQENWAEFHSATAQFNHYQLGANSRDALFIYAEKPFTQTMRKNRWPLSGVSLDSARKRVQMKQTFLILKHVSQKLSRRLIPVRAPKALVLILVFWLRCNVVLLINFTTKCSTTAKESESGVTKREKQSPWKYSLKSAQSKSSSLASTVKKIGIFCLGKQAPYSENWSRFGVLSLLWQKEVSYAEPHRESIAQAR